MFRQPDRRDAGSRGLTLLELLAVVALLSLLLVALADRGAASVDLGAPASEVPEQANGGSPEPGLRRLDALVRGAAGVRTAAPDRLDLVDAEGRVTRVSARDGALRIAPDGAPEEVLVGGVTKATFAVRTRRDLVDGEPDVRAGTLWTSDPGAGATRPMILEAGRQLALGFSVPVAAPEGGAVPEVPEELVEAVPERLVMRMGHVAGHHEVFCHRHARPPHAGGHPAGRASVTVSLHHARAPGDARPTGDALATLALPSTSLPVVEHNWYDTASDDLVIPPELLEPGTGVAWSWWEGRPEVVLNVTPSLREVAVDLTSFGRVLRPGRAYTLVLGVSGVDLLVVEVADDAPAHVAPVAVREASGRPMVAAPFGVWSRLDGVLTSSRAREVERPCAVDVRLARSDGREQDLTIRFTAGASPPVPGDSGAGARDGLDAIHRRLTDALVAPGVRVTRLSGRTLLEDAELEGIVAVEAGAVVYLDDVVVDGPIVAASLLDGGDVGAPVQLVVDGDLRVGSDHLLPGLAVAVPGGSLSTSEGRRPALQLTGDVVAREVALSGHGTLHGRVEAPSSRVDDDIARPVSDRARRLRAPGLGC